MEDDKEENTQTEPMEVEFESVGDDGDAGGEHKGVKRKRDSEPVTVPPPPPIHTLSLTHTRTHTRTPPG